MKILGQDRVLKYLAGGLAQNRLAPSLLFHGPDGVGKKLVALELAQCFSCEQPSVEGGVNLPACGECPSCQRIRELNHTDLMVINRTHQAIWLKEKPESQMALKIESVRQADKFLRIKPLESRKRTCLIEEADQLTPEATHALLKLLEDTPPNAQFILLARDIRNFPATILSRCSLQKFEPLSCATLTLWLQENHSLSQRAALVIAKQSRGSFSTALAFMRDQKEFFDIFSLEADDFFGMLSDSRWRKDSRKKAEKIITQTILASQLQLESLDFTQLPRLNVLLNARRQLDRFVSPRLVLENVYLQLKTAPTTFEGSA